ncbi:MAG: hypothetical protein AAF434_07795 [Pseudomonadota bacterium]
MAGFIGLSGMLITTEWSTAGEAAQPVSVVESANASEKAEVVSPKQESASFFSSGSALAIVLVVIALVVVARREASDSTDA